jgi:hypothetical protein
MRIFCPWKHFQADSYFLLNKFCYGHFRGDAYFLLNKVCNGHFVRASSTITRHDLTVVFYYFLSFTFLIITYFDVLRFDTKYYAHILSFKTFCSRCILFGKQGLLITFSTRCALCDKQVFLRTFLLRLINPC